MRGLTVLAQRWKVAEGCCVALLLTLVGVVPAHAAAAAAAPFAPRAVQKTPAVAVRPVAASSRSAGASQQRALSGPRQASAWPAAGSAEAALAPGAEAALSAGSLPVRVSASGPAAGSVGRARVESLGHDQATKAHVSGALFRVSRTDGGLRPGPLQVTVGYSSFRNAYGGDWANRLGLWSVPECAVTTPGAAGCQPVALPSKNNFASQEVSAEVQAAPSGTLVALASSPSGSTGDFSATSLSPSATWSSGGSTGDFSWSYQMRVPPAPGGPAPQLTLSYSSQSVDGRTAASNNQPSWLGEGFEMWPGYIERSYKACSDDMGGSANNTTATGDLCWGTDNATMSLGGQASELVRDDATGGWRPKSDDGSRIERLTGGPNGDAFGQYWRVTTVNGTQYWFGLNHLPGWTSGQRETQSTWTVPVFGNNPGEPCHQSTFDASWCNMAYRWNLDYVVDPHGNSMSYWYGQETNLYGRDGDGTKTSSYVRGGYLSEVDYGTRTGADFGGSAPMRALLTVADRCLPNTTCDPSVPASWPDTPWDQRCTASPCSDLSPAFFTRKRLASVKTQVWGGSAYRDVEQWTFAHTFNDPGDGTRAGLWLAGISHSGLVGGAASVPDITFTGIQLSNRVDSVGDGAPPMNWWRVAQINTETGGEISISYSAPQCVAGSTMPSSPDQNTLRCFPVYWAKQGASAPSIDWFQKYVVTAVSENDLTGGSPRVITTYQYLGGAAWHYDEEDGLVPASRKSWAQWRGYADVQTYHGDPPEQTETESWFFRGLDGDHLSSGGTRSVQVTASDGVAWADSDPLAGMAHEQVTDLGPGGPVVSGTISDPWLSAPTATRTINGTTVYARHTATLAATSRTALDGGRGWRTTRVTNTYDAYGMIATTDDQGDVSVPSQELCYRYSYARSTSAWLMSYQSRIEKYALSCSATPASDADVVADARTSFDGQAYGAAPTQGDVTRVEALSAWSAPGSTYVTNSTSSYDQNGRLTDKWDVSGGHSTIAYTPATSGPVTSVLTTNPLGQTATAVMEPAWGETLATIDANNHRTDMAYDPLGRMTSVWLPGRAMGQQSANQTYSYLVRNNGAVAVTSQELNPAGNYVSSYTLYDGLLRPRQTQAPSPTGGSILTDTFYNTAGEANLAYGAYNGSATPSTTLVAPVDYTHVLDQTQSVYDGAGRVVASIFQPGGQERWRTTTAYGGDRVDVTPPSGGTATSTYTDARGETVELRQYHGPTPTGAYDSTTYQYNRKGQMATVVDGTGNHWSYGYDLRGRQTSEVGPDYGTTTATYDDAGQVLTSTDARGLTLAYDYDALGRRVDVRDGSSSGTLRAQWVWDTLAKGHLTSSTRYVNGYAYTIAVSGYTSRYDPTGETITIPASEGALQGTYRFGNGWFSTNGAPSFTVYPALAGLPAESVGYSYDATLGLPSSMASGYSGYVASTIYTSIGQLSQYRMSVGTNTPSVWQSYYYETDTNRLSRSSVDRQSQSPTNLSMVTYTYDPAGNITAAQDAPTGGQAADTQCFGYDYLRRLTQAWTPSSGDCAAAPSNAGLGGPAPYWQQWSYDLTGNRLSQVDHATANGDQATTYGYLAAGAAQPHALQSATTVDSSGTRAQSYTYDAAGNTQTRPGQNGQQQLTWDAEGHLSSVVDGSATASLIYDADGNRLIRHDATGATLYLPDTELRLNASTGTVTGTRYYTYAGQTVAMRTPSGLTWLFNDPQGTSSVAINASDQSAIKRYQTPFGAVRGPQPVWPTEKGFVGGTTDPDGLVHLGAREYDPQSGRFVSADSVVDHGDPQQQNAYAYANNSPITMSDASGRRFCDGPDECQGGPIMPSHDPVAAPAPDPQPTSGPPASTAPPKPKQSSSGPWWAQAWNKAKQGFSTAVNWTEQHKAEIAGMAAGIAVGIAVGAACEAATGGVGSVGCLVLAGAAGGAVQNMVTYAIATPAKDRSLGGLLAAGAEGAATGAIGAGVGVVGGMAVGAAARAVGPAIARAVIRTAASKAIGAAEEAAAGRAGSSAATNAARSCMNSFTAGTVVLMADGSKKPIDLVKAGEKVLAGDPQEGVLAPEPVARVIVGKGLKHLYDITIDGSTIEATYNHPFWVVEEQAFVWAQDLIPGQHLLLADGRAPPITTITHHDEVTTVFNLSVNEIHTFFVGPQSVLVHNACGISVDVGAGFRGIPSPADLEAAANAPDRNGFSLAGRALQKHSSRPGSVFSGPGGGNAAAFNRLGAQAVRDIVRDPNATMEVREHAGLGPIMDVFGGPTGGGARFLTSGKFVGLLEP